MIGRRWWVPWIWLSPALLLLSVYLVYPTADTVRRSFMDNRSDNFVGFDNYQFIIENPQPFVADTHAALLNNLMWLVVFTPVTIALGLLIAILAARVRYESFAKSAIFIPMAISFVAAAVIWRFMYEFNPDIGTVNALVTEFGGDRTAWLQNQKSPQAWFTDAGPNDAIGPLQLNNFALIAVAVWMWTGFAVVVVVLSAGLKAVSRFRTRSFSSSLDRRAAARAPRCACSPASKTSPAGSSTSATVSSTTSHQRTATSRWSSSRTRSIRTCPSTTTWPLA